MGRLSYKVLSITEGSCRLNQDPPPPSQKNGSLENIVHPHTVHGLVVVMDSAKN